MAIGIFLGVNKQRGIQGDLELAQFFGALDGHLDQVVHVATLAWYVIADVMIKGFRLQTLARNLASAATGRDKNLASFARILYCDSRDRKSTRLNSSH